jgi:regulator of nonsense transcripts 1
MTEVVRSQRTLRGEKEISDSESDESESCEDSQESLEEDSDEELSRGESDSSEDAVLVVDPYDEKSLPEWACRYCGIYDPACVAKCVETRKWFCNATCPGSGGSHLVNHLVRSRNNQVQLHPESPLGDTVLECYNCASKNAFVLGFVPASTNSVVVLLCRVCVETVPALKDMDWELQQWCPLVQNRAFLSWLIKVGLDSI